MYQHPYRLEYHEGFGDLIGSALIVDVWKEPQIDINSTCCNSSAVRKTFLILISSRCRDTAHNRDKAML